MNSAASGRSRTIVIEGLRKEVPAYEAGSSQTYSAQVDMSESQPITSLWDNLLEMGYESPDWIERSSLRFTRNSTKNVLQPFERVIIVSNDQPSTKQQIRLDDMLISHANAHYGASVDFSLGENGSDNPKRPIQSLRGTDGFKVTFQRTIRMPDDNKLHQLPGSLGTLDLYNVEAYANRLPANIREVGGLFLPMWQREAMWINFECEWGRKWAVRVFIGRINAVSGLRMDEDPRKDDAEPQQDYVVIPGQKWLDGICVGPGVVRQFVSMPLGSGYTVEGQKTSEEKHGGLQIEVIPELQKALRWWVRDLQEHVSYSDTGSVLLQYRKEILETKTPSEMGFRVGDVFRAYPNPPTEQLPCTIKDLLSESGQATLKAQYEAYAPSAAMPARNTNAHQASQASEAPPDLDFTPVLGLAPAYAAGHSHHHSIRKIAKHSTSFLMGDLYNGSQALTVGASAQYSAPGPRPEDDNPVNIETKDLKAMGLAAGGKLIQDIYKDPYPADIWNHAAARIIHVHILDPLSCENVTHIVPNPPPLDILGYTEDGGQFYVVEEKVDERLEGGDFDNIKSVSQMDKQVGVTTEPMFDPLKPKMCKECEIRLCDCVIRPCDHQFCNVCIKKLESEGDQDPVLSRKNWKCPTCNKGVSHVAGFSAPMNLPGEEPMRMKVPVNVLEITDGRVKFSSIQKTRI